jgi:hypothetical protein
MRIIYITAILFLFSVVAKANDLNIIEIVIKDHQFIPNIVTAKAGTRIKLVIHNQDDTTEEFESSDLKREKIIPAGGKVNILLPKLEVGDYKFFGDFHESHPEGILRIVND